MSDGEVIRSAPYRDLLADCQEFKDLVNAHKDTIGISDVDNNAAPHRANGTSTKEKHHACARTEASCMPLCVSFLT